MAMSPRQASYLGHVLRAAAATGRLAAETVKIAPHLVRKHSKTRLGSAGIGFVAGTYTGYRVGRGIQETARSYVFGKQR